MIPWPYHAAELAAELRPDVRGNRARVAPVRADVALRAQMGGCGLAGGDNLAGVLVAQLVEREVAQLGDAHGFRQLFCTVQIAQTQTRAQVRLRIRGQRKAALSHRLPQAYGSHDIRHRLAGAHMHRHVATAAD